MSTHLYLALTPEALIASHLPPPAFGSYLAIGNEGRSSGPAIFFEIDPKLESTFLPMKDVAVRCVPHRDGSPRKSTYLSIYRVLEHIPMSAIGQLHLATADGRVLSLSPGSLAPTSDRCYHLYQEFCPVSPRVVSTLSPAEFCTILTDPAQPVSVPKIAFAELTLGALATNIDSDDVGNLPYSNLPHLRDCLRDLARKPGKPTKVAVRHVHDDVLYRTIQGGFYVGQGRDIKYYAMPSVAELDSVHHDWWRSAVSSFSS